MLKVNKTFRVGVVGAGFIANFAHLPSLTRFKEVNLIAICDENAARARVTAEQYKIAQVYTNLEQMLIGESLDLIDICLPPQKHRDALILALEHGVNCLVEKPLTVTTAEADEVIALAQSKGLGLYVIHNYSVVPAVLKAKALVKQGIIGEITEVHINHFVIPHERYFDPNHWCHALPGEYFADLVPHLAMLLVEFMGPVDTVKAAAIKLSSIYPFRFDELCIIAQNSKILGTIACSLNCPSFIFTIDIIGTKGAIHLSGDYQAVVRYEPQGHYASAWRRGMIGVKDILSRIMALAETSLGVLRRKYMPLTYGHCYLIQHCLWALQGKATYPINVFHAREAVRLLEMVFKEWR